jgi:hypothetical protein
MIQTSLIATLLISSYASEISVNKYSELANYNESLIDYENEYLKISEFLHHINDVYRLIFDTCESVDEELSMFQSSKKPNCRYNVSFINNTEIQIYSISDNVRDFIQEEKRKFCKQENIGCGELTIILKLIDLVNSATSLSVSINNTRDLWTNLHIIDFYELTNVYISSLNNMEILTNITLAKQRASIIINQEKQRLREISNNRTQSQLDSNIAKSLKSWFGYIGGSIGGFFGNFLSSTFVEITPELPWEYKTLLVLLILSIIYSKLK